MQADEKSVDQASEESFPASDSPALTASAPAMGETRTEHDYLGEVRVPVQRLWGAQTQRSLENFRAGGERFRWGRSVIRALGIAKKCAALANRDLGVLPEELAARIV
jgi:fumarate hydratase class II